MNEFGTRDEESMRAYVRNEWTGVLRATLAEAERDGDRALAVIVREELRRRHG